MKGKISLVLGGTVGYVLGTKAGRERYEQIMAQAQGFWQNPKVQGKKQEAQDLVKEKAPEVKSKAGDAAASAKSKVSKSSEESTTPTPSTTTTTSMTPGPTTSTTPGTTTAGGLDDRTAPHSTSPSTGL